MLSFTIHPNDLNLENKNHTAYPLLFLQTGYKSKWLANNALYEYSSSIKYTNSRMYIRAQPIRLSVHESIPTIQYTIITTQIYRSKTLSQA